MSLWTLWRNQYNRVNVTRIIFPLGKIHQIFRPTTVTVIVLPQMGPSKPCNVLDTLEVIDGEKIPPKGALGVWNNYHGFLLDHLSLEWQPTKRGVLQLKIPVFPKAMESAYYVYAVCGLFMWGLKTREMVSWGPVFPWNHGTWKASSCISDTYNIYIYTYICIVHIHIYIVNYKCDIYIYYICVISYTYIHNISYIYML